MVWNLLFPGLAMLPLMSSGDAEQRWPATATGPGQPGNHNSELRMPRGDLCGPLCFV